jgi:hypothetical protein
MHFIDSMVVLWRQAACETPRASASQTFALSGQNNLLDEQRAKQKNDVANRECEQPIGSFSSC